MAITPALFPKKGPRLVILFNTLFSLSFGGAVAGDFRSPSIIPHVPPSVRAERYVMPVP